MKKQTQKLNKPTMEEVLTKLYREQEIRQWLEEQVKQLLDVKWELSAKIINQELLINKLKDAIKCMIKKYAKVNAIKIVYNWEEIEL